MRHKIQKNVTVTVINFSWEGYAEISEFNGGIFDVSREGWHSYIKDQVGTIYKDYSDNAKLFSSFPLYSTLKTLKKGGTLKYEY